MAELLIGNKYYYYRKWGPSCGTCGVRGGLGEGGREAGGGSSIPRSFDPLQLDLETERKISNPLGPRIFITLSSYHGYICPSVNNK